MRSGSGRRGKNVNGVVLAAGSALAALLVAGCCALGTEPSPSGSAAPARTSEARSPGGAKDEGGMSLAPSDGSASAAAGATGVLAAPAPPVPLSTAVPCGAKAPPPWPRTNPDLGQWGEDLRTAPSFGYEQERRAPKMPDAGNYLARTPARTVEKLEDALLICHVEVYTRHGEKPAFYHYKLAKPEPSRPRCFSDWDFFAPPDVLLQFRLRGEHPIALFAPEDHWGFFISVPRVRLARGDLLEVKLFDRDSAGDSAGASEESADYMGYASTTLTGKWPIRMKGPYFTMACNAMTSAEAQASARRWLTALDGTLSTLAARRPDPRKWDFGSLGTSIDRGEFSFGKGNFRYAASFLGWDHPAILERREKVKRITEIDWPKKKSEAAKLLAKQAPAPGKPMALGGRRGTLRATGVVCQGSTCTVTFELTGSTVLPSSQDWHVDLAGIDGEGHFHAVEMVAEAGGEEAPAHGAAPVKSRTYRMTVPEGVLVVWISAPTGLHTVKVRDPG